MCDEPTADKSHLPVCSYQMADSSFPELPQNNKDDVLELNKDLEMMIENIEKISGV